MILKTALEPDTWGEEQEKGATDEQILNKVDEICGGNQFGFGPFLTIKPGKDPCVWFGEPKGEPKLKKGDLIIKIRELLGVPEPEFTTALAIPPSIFPEVLQTETEDSVEQPPEPDLNWVLDIVRNPNKERELSDDEEKAISYLLQFGEDRLAQVDQLSLEVDTIIGILYYQMQGNHRKSTRGTFKEIIQKMNFFGKSATTCYEIGHAFTELQWAIAHKQELGFDPEAIPSRDVWKSLRRRVAGKTPQETTVNKILVLKAAKSIADEQNQGRIEDSHLPLAISKVEEETAKSISTPKKIRERKSSDQSGTGSAEAERLQAIVKAQEAAARILEAETKAAQFEHALNAEKKAKEKIKTDNERLHKIIGELTAKPEAPPAKQLEIANLIKKPEGAETATESVLREQLQTLREECIRLEGRSERQAKEIETLKKQVEEVKKTAIGYDEEARVNAKLLDAAKAENEKERLLLGKYRLLANRTYHLSKINPPEEEAPLIVLLKWRETLEKLTLLISEIDEYLADLGEETIKADSHLSRFTELVDKVIDQCLTPAGFFQD